MVKKMALKPAICEFYEGMRVYSALVLSPLSTGGFGVGQFHSEYVFDNKSLCVLTNILQISPVCLLGGAVYAPATVGDATLTQFNIRINGYLLVGLDVVGVNLGLPLSIENYNLRVRHVIPPCAQIQFFYWCQAPSLVAPGDVLIFSLLFSLHKFDKKVLQFYSNYEIMEFVKNVGD